MHRKLTTALLLALPACVLDKDLGNGTLLTTDSTGEPGATDDGGATGDGTEPTTGVPNDCPEGQPHLAQLWQFEYDQFLDFQSSFAPIGRLADGRIAVPGNFDLAPDQHGVALMLVAPDGQLLGPQTAAPGDKRVGAVAFAIGADDQPVVLGNHGSDIDGVNIMKLTRFTSDMQLVSQIDVPFVEDRGPPYVPTLALSADGPVVAGPVPGGPEPVLVKLAPDTGALVWQHTFTATDDLVITEIAIGPTGDIAVAGHADTELDAQDAVRLWRFDPAGAQIWERVITVPEFEEVTALHFAPDGQIVALRNGKEFAASVDLVSVEVATGETRWALTVAAVEDELGGWAEDMHVDADRFTIPMSRSRVHHHAPADTNWTEVRTVSFAGELLAVTKVPGVLGDGGLSWLRSVRGRCGELILVRDIDSLQVTALAP
ncbi:MAG TPA: hypothetical protein VGB85_15115 [Nannocystis sp.]|jgi:hypothetical protein